jgi:hypothetical protein
MSFSLGISYAYYVALTPCLVFNRYIHSFTRYTKAAFVPLTIIIYSYLFLQKAVMHTKSYLNTVFLLFRRFFVEFSSFVHQKPVIANIV